MVYVIRQKEIDELSLHVELQNKSRKTCSYSVCEENPSHRRSVYIDNSSLLWNPTIVHLGVVLDQRLTLSCHVKKIKSKFVKARNIVYPLIGRRSVLSVRGKLRTYTSILRQVIIYAALLLVVAAKTHISAHPMVLFIGCFVVREKQTAARRPADPVSSRPYPLLGEGIMG